MKSQLIADSLCRKIPQGFTIYGEAVGWTKNSKPIQKGYTYCCEPGTFKTLIYRVTFTNPEGEVIELTWPQMREFCKKQDLEMVKEIFYGYAAEQLPKLH